MSSLASNITELRKLWSDEVDPKEVAASFLQAEAEGARRMVEARQDPAIDAHFYDIDFQDLIDRPVEVMQKLYRHFGLPYTDATHAGLQRYAAATWSGDVASRWSDMHEQISAGINFSMSAIGRSANSRDNFLVAGTRMPRKWSPAPYWPGAVLKNRCRNRASSGSPSS